MFQEERINMIMEQLNRNKRIDIKDICQQFDVSRDTARRDLLRMEELGLILRTHGGAVLPQKSKEIFEYKDRLIKESSVKRDIGQLAASLVNNGDFIMMDASTTVQFAAEHLTAEHVVAVTNSIDIADALSRKKAVRTYLLGGELNLQHRFLFGQAAIDSLANYQVDKLFLGACGITSDGLSYPDVEDGVVKREMIKKAKQVIVLADHTKFGDQMFYKIAGLDAIDLLITDQQPDRQFMEKLAEHHVELLVVSEEELDDKTDRK
ncbi:DeoR/GlpR family DNA-binding transcription regulator [Paenibacillus sp. LHD-117]|uniref:DeoR/GlpR family DNA-binding transcription regulator n=1 Tax=Paenibacillus sp. LHD-117 TaxID=3071412 RepID=UPI0027E0997B|nr:DeoR/GlpR family DNA-binding transcription regulator [Paenibacillus sp. LHD-117]MDQ6418397.1 DeoR/GlpR family DNA-binding transcription regulator [Paenibacillus sp. LHD-117]